MTKEEIMFSINREENMLNFINNEMVLYEECWCGGEDCWDCWNTGIKITDNGYAILNLIKVAEYVKKNSKEE